MNIASYIEQTILRPDLNISDIDRIVADSIESGFAGVCVPPFWVRRAFRERGSAKISLVTVAGFPFGHSMTETKLDEIRRAIDNGADEVDVVWNISSFKTGIPWTKIEIAKCSRLLHEHQRLLKVIIETAYLSSEEIRNACKLCADAGTDFVKTSTGYAPRGASVDDVKVMREALGAAVGIKASGGIKSFAQAKLLIDAGADRIGTSSGTTIIKESTLT